MRRPPWGWRGWLLVGLAAVVVVVGAGVAWVLWPRSPTPITEQEAIEEFRGDAATSTSPTTAGGPPTPAAGVYLYRADGTEDIEMGPLPLPTRDIPSEVTVVVVLDDGCYRLGLNLMAEHTEQTTWCAEPDGTLVLQGQTKQEQVPGFQVDATTTCDPGVVIAPGAGEQPVRCQLRMDVSGVVLDVDLEGTATVEPGEPVVVEGTEVATRHLALALTASGDMSGHWNEEHWLADDLLPVRMVRDILLDGPGRFEERTTLTLQALAPRT